MRAARQDDLDALYAASPDPWSFRTSAYEVAKHRRTVAALSRPRYGALLEIGCGNGELARRLARRCDAYVGLDAASRALVEARRAVPTGRFVRGFLPCPLPDGPFDAIVLSEILYFLDLDGITSLARQIGVRWPAAEIVAVNYRLCSAQSLNGDDAADGFAAALPDGFRRCVVREEPSFRIDRFGATAGTPA